jgi:amino acid transporter
MGVAKESAPVMVAQSSSARNALPVQPPAQAAPVHRTSPQPTLPSDVPPKGSPYAVVGTGGFIGTMILFCVPVIGWIVCVIMAFAAKNRNRRNFARAMLVFLIIGVILSVALYFLFNWVADVFMEYVSEATGNIQEFKDIFSIFGKTNISGLPGQ